MKVDLKNRRMFLQGVGGASFLVPFLPSLVSEKLLASTGSASPFDSFTRIHIPYALFQQVQFDPIGNGIAPNSSNSAMDYQTWNLNGPIWNTSSMFFDIPEAQRNKDNFSFFQFDFLGYINHMAKMAGAFDARQGQTIDRYIAQHLMAQRSYAFDTVAIGENKNSAWMFQQKRNGKVSPVIQQKSPVAALDAVKLRFGSTAAETQALKNARIKDIDLALNEYNRFLNSSRLSAADKLRLAEYVSLFNDQRSQIVGQPNQVCSTASVTMTGEPDTKKVNHTKDALEVLFLNIMCGNAPIYGYCASPSPIHGIGHSLDNINGTSAAAVTTHQGLLKPTIQEIFAFIDRLATTMDSNGKPYADRNPVIVTWDMSSHHNHTPNRVAAIVAGGGGVFKLGQYVRYGTSAPNLPFGRGSNSRPYSEFLVGLLNGYGVPASLYASESFNNNYSQYDATYWDNYNFSRTRVAPEILV